MRGEKLDTQIIIESYGESQGDFGTPEETWSTYLTTMANKIYKTITTTFDGEREKEIEVIEYWIRWNPNITKDMRINDNGKIYDIKGEPMEMHRRRATIIRVELE